MKKNLFILCAAVTLPFAANANSEHSEHSVSDNIIQEQRQQLAINAEGQGFGPQAPRDISDRAGSNARLFSVAVPSSLMNLCNIHFHKNAEHKGGEYTTYAGNGDGHGYNSGYKYSGTLSKAELTPLEKSVGKNQHGELFPGDTIEVHYVYSSAQVKPGATLKSCLSNATVNPQLRVEAQVFVLVNDKSALDFMDLTSYQLKDGYQQAINIPNNAGTPIEYIGSTTGPVYNETPSPYQVTWSVRPKVLKVDIHTVANWLQNNDFNEDHAHGVRNLVTNPALLSVIK